MQVLQGVCPGQIYNSYPGHPWRSESIDTLPYFKCNLHYRKSFELTTTLKLTLNKIVYRNNQIFVIRFTVAVSTLEILAVFQHINHKYVKHSKIVFASNFLFLIHFPLFVRFQTKWNHKTTDVCFL